MSIDHLVSKISEGAKSPRKSPSSHLITMTQDEVNVLKVTTVAQVIKTPAFLEMKKAIDALKDDNRHSRSEAILTLQAELARLRFAFHKDVVSLLARFSYLGRRLTLFAEMDLIVGIFIKLEELEELRKQKKLERKNPNWFLELGFEISRVYFYLSLEEPSYNNAGVRVLNDQQAEESLFEIKTAIVSHFLHKIISEKSDEKQKALYVNWVDLEEEDKVLEKEIKRYNILPEKYIAESLVRAQEVLEMTFDEMDIQNLTEAMRTVPKSIVHEPLYKLEKEIKAMVKPPEEIARVVAVGQLQKSLKQFLISNSTLDEVYQAYLNEYQRFQEFEEALISFNEIISILYRGGARPLKPITSAVNQAYFSYSSQEGNTKLALAMFRDEIAAVRIEIFNDHRKEGAFVKWGLGIFQPGSSLVYAMDRALLTLGPVEKVGVECKQSPRLG